MDWLLDTGPWRSWEESVFAIANMLLALCSTVVAMCIMVLWHYKKQDARHPIVLILFAVFLFSLGVGHLIKLFLFTHHLYRIILLTDLFAAFTSLTVFFTAPFITLSALRIPSRNVFEKTKEEKSKLEVEKVVLEEKLVRKEHDTQMLKHELTTKDSIINKMADVPKPLETVITQLSEIVEAQGDGNK